MKMYTLRLRTEDKKLSTSPYDPLYIKFIQTSVQQAAKKFKLPYYVFETVVKTHQDRLCYCSFRMTEELFIFFCNAYGTRKKLEKDYEITEKHK